MTNIEFMELLQKKGYTVVMEDCVPTVISEKHVALGKIAKEVNYAGSFGWKKGKANTNLDN